MGSRRPATLAAYRRFSKLSVVCIQDLTDQAEVLVVPGGEPICERGTYINAAFFLHHGVWVEVDEDVADGDIT